MCNYCEWKSEKSYGYCVKCGKEICKHCASSTDKNIHETCLNVAQSRTHGASSTPDSSRTRAPGIIADPGIDFGPR